MLFRSPCTYDGTSYKLQTEVFTSPHEAIERARHTAFDLVLSDFRMPEMDGVAFLKEIRRIQPNAARMILSGYADLNGLIGAINEAQIYRFVSKPWNDYELVSAIAQALAYHDLALENQHLADEARVASGRMTAEELALKELEAQEPGITQVTWGPDGSVILDDESLPR